MVTIPPKTRRHHTRKAHNRFLQLKKQITANVNWERQNFVAALCHTLESVGFNVSYQNVVPETGSTQAAIEAYQRF